MKWVIIHTESLRIWYIGFSKKECIEYLDFLEKENINIENLEIANEKTLELLGVK